MLTGRNNPELGGAPAYLDILGVNYYSDNQWRSGRLDHPARPPRLQAALGAPGRRPRALRPSDPGGRDRGRGRRPGALAPLRRPGGPRRAGGRRAGRGDLRLPDPRISGLGERAPLRHRPALRARPGAGAALCTSRWPGSWPASRRYWSRRWPRRLPPGWERPHDPASAATPPPILARHSRSGRCPMSGTTLCDGAPPMAPSSS